MNRLKKIADKENLEKFKEELLNYIEGAGYICTILNNLNVKLPASLEFYDVDDIEKIAREFDYSYIDFANDVVSGEINLEYPFIEYDNGELKSLDISAVENYIIEDIDVLADEIIKHKSYDEIQEWLSDEAKELLKSL